MKYGKDEKMVVRLTNKSVIDRLGTDVGYIIDEDVKKNPTASSFRVYLQDGRSLHLDLTEFETGEG